ncbi:hypothetical protein ACFOGG_13885 [Brenneria rubrifaciens]|uniref:hypothetical protein n=1 Tax=Brenneria rubrifaciens TaxID=55213 RepID=UPI00360A9DF2
MILIGSGYRVVGKFGVAVMSPPLLIPAIGALIRGQMFCSFDVLAEASLERNWPASSP